MSTIAFIGLGIMGSPMACHLVKAGHTVTGLDMSPDRTAAVVEAGGKAGEYRRLGEHLEKVFHQTRDAGNAHHVQGHKTSQGGLSKQCAERECKLHRQGQIARIGEA